MLALFYLGRKERNNCGVPVSKLICSFNIFIAAGVVVERVHSTAAAAVLLPLAGLVVVSVPAAVAGWASGAAAAAGWAGGSGAAAAAAVGWG